MNSEFIWSEKYRPHTVADTILPPDLKIIFQGFVDQGKIPNITLAGSAGIGKTTIARAMIDEIGADYYMINGSISGNIDTLRNDIQDFASTMSMKGGRKYVILDEADYLNANSTQPALRGFIEEYSKGCGFILTCNYPKRIIEPLHSRCPIIEFNITKSEASKMAAQFFRRVVNILNTEQIKYDKAVVAEVINKFYPDWRRVLNELQRYSSSGSIDTGILANLGKGSYDDLVSFMRQKNFTKVREWVGELSNNDHTSLFNEFYDNCIKYFIPQAIPSLVLILAKYQYQAAFVASHEINMSACLLEIMTDCPINE